MATTYCLVLRKDLRKGAASGSQLYYAQAKASGESSLDYLCTMISARSSISSADTKAVLDSLVFMIMNELREGRIVRLGDLGSFRATFGSEGVSDPTEFNASTMIRTPKYTFVPGRLLKDARRSMSFKRILSAKDAQVECDKPHSLD